MRLLLVASVLVLGGGGGGGCGGDGDGGAAGDPIGAVEAQDLCSGYGAHATQCGWTDVPNVDWNCGEAAMVWRADVFREFTLCVTALACTGDGMTCVASTHTDITPLASHDDYAERCTAKFTECGLPTLGCTADAWEFYTDAFTATRAACFDMPCDAVLACLEGN